MSDALVIVITGATHGIGRAAAIELARRGAHLGLVARSEAKAAQTRADIQRAAPGAVVDVFLADLSVLEDVRRVARQIDARYGRIVNVASDAHRQVRTLEPERDLRSTDAFSMAESFELYARSKLMDILFTQELAFRLAGTGVTANSCCPGLNASGLGRESKVFNGLAGFLTRLGLLSPERGARIIVQLATSPELKEVTGGFFSSTRRFRSLPPVPLFRDAELRRRLWRATAELVARS